MWDTCPAPGWTHWSQIIPPPGTEVPVPPTRGSLVAQGGARTTLPRSSQLLQGLSPFYSRGICLPLPTLAWDAVGPVQLPGQP